MSVFASKNARIDKAGGEEGRMNEENGTFVCAYVHVCVCMCV